MASGNRVEELESQVKELQATVDGLTEELVECKVRVKELEQIVDEEIGLETIDDIQAEAPEPDPEPEPAETPDETGDAAEESKSEGSQGEDNTESEGSDIIVA
jgi:uncharacterized coiled-coil protein SlyX